jgi:hypothetical protein
MAIMRLIVASRRAAASFSLYWSPWDFVMRISLEDWPGYLPGPQEDILVLGVIALNYGQMENAFRRVFSNVTRMNDIQVAAIFGRIPNNIRQTVLAEVMAQTTLPDKLKEQVNYFTLGFKTCADNRHDVMHSHSGGVFTSLSTNTRGILLSKYSKSGKKLVCPAPLEKLREVADDIHDYAIFGLGVAGEINNFKDCRDHDDEDSFWRVPLTRRPLPPTGLRWHSPKDILIEPSPPLPSGA